MVAGPVQPAATDLLPALSATGASESARVATRTPVADHRLLCVPMEFRHASEADLPGAFAVFVAVQTEPHDRRGTPWPAADHPPPTAITIPGEWLY
jgi:hypothetical protein